MVSGPKPRTMEEIIIALQKQSTYREATSCYLFQGHTAGDGYGCISFRGKQVYIHRLIFEYVFGEVPNIVRHSCDTPNCWNPDHLHDGTTEDNVTDKVIKQRHCFGEAHYRSKLTVEMVKEIRGSILSPVDLARKFNVSRGAIHEILKGRTWKHV